MDILESLLGCEDLDPTEPALSDSPPVLLPSSLATFLSFLLLLEKKDLPPEDCRALLSAADMIAHARNGRLDHCYANCLVGCASP
jgi:hypothetical protein